LRTIGKLRALRAVTFLAALLTVQTIEAGEGAARREPEWFGPKPAARPSRVVSLAPSLTDTVVALGLSSRLVGVTRHDVAPQVKDLPRVGGFLDPSPEAVLALRPDLVLWLADSGAWPAVHRIAELGVPVLALPVVGVADVLRTARLVGQALGEPAAGEALSADVERAERRAASLPRRRALLVIGRYPLVVAGPGSYPDALLRLAGGDNVVRGDKPYPVYPLERAVADDPELVIDAAVNERSAGLSGLEAIPAVKAGRVVSLPDDRVLRPGPQLGQALAELLAAVHPEAKAP